MVTFKQQPADSPKLKILWAAVVVTMITSTKIGYTRMYRLNFLKTGFHVPLPRVSLWEGCRCPSPLGNSIRAFTAALVHFSPVASQVVGQWGTCPPPRLKQCIFSIHTEFQKVWRLPVQNCVFCESRKVTPVPPPSIAPNSGNASAPVIKK